MRREIQKCIKFVELKHENDLSNELDNKYRFHDKANINCHIQ